MLKCISILVLLNYILIRIEQCMYTLQALIAMIFIIYTFYFYSVILFIKMLLIYFKIGKFLKLYNFSWYLVK